MPILNYADTELFADHLNNIKKKDPQNYKRIKAVIDRLLRNPGLNDGPMHGISKGVFKKYIGRDELRVYFSWCQKCRESGHQEQNKCDRCDELSDNTLIFKDVVYKHEAERHGY